MNVLHPNVTYSSIVKIGEETQQLEKETGKKFLKLHRGVMNVVDISIDDMLPISPSIKTITQYGANDGSPILIDSINKLLCFTDCKTILTPGGMAALDIIINSLSDEIFHISQYHWGSWNKILKIHGKTINTYNEFDLDTLRPKEGVVMMCFPSNPTGYQPEEKKLNDFLLYAKLNNITVILDLPYYHLFNEFDDSISKILTENVIILSSFSKSFGLSGFRIGYITTKSTELYETLKIRSLYKYNSISTLPQIIINNIIDEYNEIGDSSVLNEYRKTTRLHIKNNIQYLIDNNLLMGEYPSPPIGPFAIVKLTQKELLDKHISSVPLSKFTLDGSGMNLTRISVAVNHDEFVKYMSN